MNVSLMIDCVTNTIKKLFAISCNIAKLVVTKTEYALSLFIIIMARWCLSRWWWWWWWYSKCRWRPSHLIMSKQQVGVVRQEVAFHLWFGLFGRGQKRSCFILRHFQSSSLTMTSASPKADVGGTADSILLAITWIIAMVAQMFLPACGGIYQTSWLISGTFKSFGWTVNPN